MSEQKYVGLESVIELNHKGFNETVVILPRRDRSAVRILFSYETPVAFEVEGRYGVFEGCLNISRTTIKHIKRFLGMESWPVEVLRRKIETGEILSMSQMDFISIYL